MSGPFTPSSMDMLQKETRQVVNTMSSAVLILLAIFVVAVLVIVWARSADHRRRCRAAALLDVSAGGYDAAAVEALTEINAMDRPAAVDHFARAGILHYNLLEGNLRRREAAPHTVNIIARDYAAALGGIQRGEIDMDTEFMIMQMEGFGGALGMAGHDVAPAFNDMLAATTPGIRAEQIERRRRSAQDVAENRAEAAAVALDMATTYTNDRQNVHDSHVNRDLRATLNKMRNDGSSIDADSSINDVRDFIRGRYAREFPEKARRAERVLDIARRGERIGTFNESEDRILATVWERCKHPRNKGKRDLMFEAVAHSLADSLEGDTPVCINGRTGRVLNSLATLDFDADISDGAMTYEAYRNQIFQETKDIIKDTTDRAKNSPDRDLSKAATAYDEGGDDVAAFTETLKRELHTHVDSYGDKLSSDERDNIKAEITMYAAAD